MKIAARQAQVERKKALKISGFALGIVTALTLTCFSPVFAAEGQDAAGEDQAVAGLVSVMTEKATTAMRGGDAKHKGLGFYAVQPNVDFKSGYALIPAKTMAKWAYDLHQFVLSKGGSYENVKKFTQEHPTDPKKYVDPFLPGQKPDVWDPYARAHVSYDEQKKFAEKWWSDNADYRDCMTPKDWWITDAILDGNNLWYRYEATVKPASAGYITWRDGELEKLAKKQ